VKNTNCDIFIELIGEEKGLSFDLVKKALENKIHVITANKAMLSKYGNELFKIAEKNNVLLLFEAAIAGGIPIVKVVKQSIFLNKIKKVSGILNGTTNFILSEMENKKLNFEEVLKNGDHETGCTIHFVTETVDDGPVLVQKRCTVETNETMATLKLKVQALEGGAFIEAIQLIQNNKYVR